MHQRDSTFHKKTIWSDEAPFSKHGIFYKQNKTFWYEEKRHVTVSYNTQGKFDVNDLCFVKENRLHYETFR